MNTNKEAGKMKDRKVIFSTLWIFAMFNYLYADFISFVLNPAMQNMAMRMTAMVVLGWAVFMETAIAMVLLSRVLKYRANRWANIIAGVLHTAAVSWTLFSGKPAPYYIFFAALEIACTVFIVWYAWHWPKPADQAYKIVLEQG
jgi:hypothetical protein